MSAAAVSIAVPCYNRQAYIGDTIDSIAAQTMTDWELIVVDDASTDQSVAVIEGRLSALRDQGRAVRLVKLDRNVGVTRALSHALELSAGTWFTYLGSDDLWEPDKLERQIAAVSAAGERCGACFCDCWVIDEAGRRYDRLGRMYPYRGGEIFLDILRFRFVPPSPGNFFVRERMIEAGGFNPAIPEAEDFDLWVRMARSGTIAYVDAPLASYRVHKGNMSSGDPETLFRATMRTLETMIREDPRARVHRREIVGRARARLAGAWFNALETKRARQAAWSALRVNPRDLIAWRIALGSLLGARGVDAVRSLRRRMRGRVS